MSKQKKIVLSIGAILLILGMILWAKGSVFHQEEASIDPQNMNGEALSYQGKTYKYNKDLVNVLFLGIDQRGPLSDVGIVGKGKQADVILLASFDPKKKKLKVLNISRDSMVKVARHNYNGEFYDYETMQLCLQYAYGKNHEESGNLMKERVSEVLYGLPIEHYFSMNLDTIPIINDAVGGVSVTLEDDFTYFDKTMKKGETLTLKGEQALYYIWDRRITSIGNAERMTRQKKYLKGFIPNAKKAWKEDITLPLEVLKQITPYTKTDLSGGKMAQLIGWGLQCKDSAIELIQIPGNVTNDGEHWQFHIDENKLQKLLIDLFYQEAK